MSSADYEHPYPAPELEARYSFVPLDFDRVPEETMKRRAAEFYQTMARRRSVRMFSPDPVPRDLLAMAIETASTAPSGAHRQPWTFALTRSPEMKVAIREAAEEEERRNYLDGRMNKEWQAALQPIGTDWHKEFLEVAPWIVVLFEQRYGLETDGDRSHNYYVKESVGIAAGMFIAALHVMGLTTLTHTPSPMAFLTRLFGRPDNERPFVLFPVGYPLENTKVPDLQRKPLSQVMVSVETPQAPVRPPEAD